MAILDAANEVRDQALEKDQDLEDRPMLAGHICSSCLGMF